MSDGAAVGVTALVVNTRTPPARISTARGPVMEHPGWDALIVTKYPELFASLGLCADIIGQTAAALEMIKTRPYTVIFCDMGPLAARETGFRFISALKSAGNTVPTFLMAEALTEYNRAWIQSNGGTGLIRRDLAALLQAVELVRKPKPSP